MRTLKLFCNNTNLKTLKKFGEFYKIRFTKEFTLNSFFEFNRKTIFDQLDNSYLTILAKKKKKKISDLTPNDIDVNVTLPCPSYLLIAEEHIDYSLIAKNTNFQASEVNVMAFEDKNIRSILSDDSVEIFHGNKKMRPGCRVLGWFKSLYFYEKNGGGSNGIDNIYDSSQNFIDLSRFVSSLNTNVTESGGNFSISFSHIPVYADTLVSEMDQHFLYNGGINVSSQKNENGFINKNQIDDIILKDKDGNEQVISKSDLSSFDYLEWLIQANDLLFISFDNMEDLVDDNLANHNFDMIALVDSVSISKNAQGNVNIDVSGRDLMKLITDDSSIFFPLGVSASEGSIFNNTETVVKGGDLSSVYKYKGSELVGNSTRQLTGMLNIFACEPNDFSIDFVLKTVVSHLANLQIVPDDLFTSWGDKRTKFSTLKPKRKE